MKRYLGWIGIAAFALVLDVTLFLPHGKWLGLYPALCLATCAAWSVQEGLVLALLGGLLTDAFSNPYAGLTAAGYCMSVALFWLLIRKNAPKPIGLVLYGIVSIAACLVPELIFSLILGARLSSPVTVLSQLAAFCVLTAAAMLPLERLLARWKRGQRDRI